MVMVDGGGQSAAGQTGCIGWILETVNQIDVIVLSKIDIINVNKIDVIILSNNDVKILIKIGVINL